MRGVAPVHATHVTTRRPGWYRGRVKPESKAMTYGWLNDLGTISFERELKVEWKETPLWEAWADRYPTLFDDDDRRLAASQAPLGFHFVEWLAAIHFWETQRLRSLISKYQYPSHKCKLETFTRYAGAEVVRMVQEARRAGAAQAPDLFLYQPRGTDWMFCEVKGPRDRLRDSQIELFSTLASATGRAVGLLRVKEA